MASHGGETRSHASTRRNTSAHKGPERERVPSVATPQATQTSTSARGASEEQSPSVALDAIALLGGLATIAALFHAHAPTPYMDEPFHVPQTQRYCRGEVWEWDPKITTFPGLYFFGAIFGRAWHALSTTLASNALFAKAEVCGTTALRAVNLGFAAACYLLAHATYRRIHPAIRSDYASQIALTVVLLPTSFFFIFLYYTDVGSLAFFLASYLAVLQQRYKLAALASACSVLFRQTNAVWAAFTALVAVLRIFARNEVLQDPNSGLFRQVVALAKLSWLNRRALLARLWPLLMVPAAFTAFVGWNGGIVVGDRSNHTPKLHLTQPLYCLLFCAGFLPQIMFHPARLADAFWRATDAFRRSPAGVLKSLGIAFVFTTFLVHNFTLAHPFLLADNRHFTFYIWKDVIAAYPTARYCLVPLYLFSGWSLHTSLRGGGRSDVWVAGLAVCACATLAPAWLLELRYFTIPFVVVVLNMKPPQPAQLLMSIAIFAAINAATIYLFLYRPFRWPDGSLARFMW